MPLKPPPPAPSSGQSQTLTGPIDTKMKDRQMHRATRNRFNVWRSSVPAQDGISAQISCWQHPQTCFLSSLTATLSNYCTCSFSPPIFRTPYAGAVYMRRQDVCTRRTIDPLNVLPQPASACTSCPKFELLLQLRSFTLDSVCFRRPVLARKYWQPL